MSKNDTIAQAELPPNDLYKVIAREEAVANFSAMNKIREALMVAMIRDVEKGGDGLRYMKTLEVLQKELSTAKNVVEDFT